jgi:NADH-quinone oxidoreductase subunit H
MDKPLTRNIRPGAEPLNLREYEKAGGYQALRRALAMAPRDIVDEVTKCNLLGLLGISAGLIWAERRLLALWQERWGPNRVGPAGLLQPAADILEILWKEDWVPPLADRPVFVVAPALVMVAAMMSFAVVPFAPGIGIADLNIGLLFFLAMSSMAVYGVALGGWSSNNKYALLGSLRAVGQMVSYEVFMGLALMGVVVQAGTFSLREIVEAQRGLWFCVPQGAGFVVFLIAGLAETRRLPFDLPEAENELVAGYHTECSGMKFAMFFLGEYIGITLVSALIVTLFFGGWLGPLLPPIAWFLIKTGLFISLFILARAALPRPRYDQLMAFGWKLMLPLALANFLVTGAVVLARGP